MKTVFYEMLVLEECVSQEESLYTLGVVSEGSLGEESTSESNIATGS